VGDSVADMDLGRVIGAESILVRTGYGKETEEQLSSAGLDGRYQVVDNLLDAVESIL